MPSPDVQAHAEDSRLLKGDRAVDEREQDDGEELVLREHRGDGEQARAAQSGDADRSPSPLRAQAPHQGVAGRSARQVGARRDRVGQRRQQQAALA